VPMPMLTLTRAALRQFTTTRLTARSPYQAEDSHLSLRALPMHLYGWRSAGCYMHILSIQHADDGEGELSLRV